MVDKSQFSKEQLAEYTRILKELHNAEGQYNLSLDQLKGSLLAVAICLDVDYDMVAQDYQLLTDQQITESLTQSDEWTVKSKLKDLSAILQDKGFSVESITPVSKVIGKDGKSFTISADNGTFYLDSDSNKAVLTEFDVKAFPVFALVNACIDFHKEL